MTDIRLFDYNLPEELIAQYPAAERDGSRLLTFDRVTGRTADRVFSDLPGYLREGDLLVFNNSRVIKARLIGEKEGTGARIELFLVRRLQEEESGLGMASGTGCGESWEVLARPAKRLRAGDRVLFRADVDEYLKTGDHEYGQLTQNGILLTARIIQKNEDGSVIVSFEYEGIFLDGVERLGHIPLPPYIRRPDDSMDAERYQTVYAAHPGSAAAPTAGLHFTDDMLGRLRAKGVETAFVTLHVGPGTFSPVQTDAIEEHRMHKEFYHIGEEARRRINLAKADGRRIICVGTTSVRTIESASIFDHDGNRYIPGSCADGSTDIFIYPGGREFFMTDGMITNFHLPKSTLFMLVSAFAGRERMLNVYHEAIEKGYRFFSYGDAMLIL